MNGCLWRTRKGLLGSSLRTDRTHSSPADYLSRWPNSFLLSLAPVELIISPVEVLGFAALYSPGPLRRWSSLLPLSIHLPERLFWAEGCGALAEEFGHSIVESALGLQTDAGLAVHRPRSGVTGNKCGSLPWRRPRALGLHRLQDDGQAWCGGFFTLYKDQTHFSLRSKVNL